MASRFSPATGGLPETTGDTAPMIEIPACHTSQTRDVRTAEEVVPPVESIVRLWDDAAEYDRCGRAARERAQAWRPTASRLCTATS